MLTSTKYIPILYNVLFYFNVIEKKYTYIY